MYTVYQADKVLENMLTLRLPVYLHDELSRAIAVREMDPKQHWDCFTANAKSEVVHALSTEWN